VVFDSVANLVPRAEIDGEMDENHMGLHARLMGKGLRKLVGVVAKTNASCIFINQIRFKIGGYGNPETTTGGNALRFYSWLRLETRTPRSGKIMEKSRGSLDDADMESGAEIGSVMNIKAVKNKLFMPYRTCSLNIFYGKGIDAEDDLVQLMARHGILSIESAKKIKYNGKQMLRSRWLEEFNKNKKFRDKMMDKLEKEGDVI